MRLLITNKNLPLKKIGEILKIIDHEGYIVQTLNSTNTNHYRHHLRDSKNLISYLYQAKEKDEIEALIYDKITGFLKITRNWAVEIAGGESQLKNIEDALAKAPHTLQYMPVRLNDADFFSYIPIGKVKNMEYL